METSKISAKGQVTIPVKIRRLLDTDMIAFEVLENGQILLKPVPSVAGSLKEYAREYIPFEQVREQVRQQVVHERSQHFPG